MLRFRRKSNGLKMRRSRCRARAGVGGGYTPPIQGCFTRLAGKCAAADLEGFAHSAAADGEKSSAGQAEQPKEAAIWTRVFACPSPGGDLELRLCMFERRESGNAIWYDSEDDFDLRFCISQRRRRYGLTLIMV